MTAITRRLVVLGLIATFALVLGTSAQGASSHDAAPPQATDTPTVTETATATATPTSPPPTLVYSPSLRPVPTDTPTATATDTVTPTVAATPTPTATPRPLVYRMLRSQLVRAKPDGRSHKGPLVRFNEIVHPEGHPRHGWQYIVTAHHVRGWVLVVNIYRG